MKTLHLKLSRRIINCKRILTASACLFAGVLTSSADVTVQGWWRGGEAGGVQLDSSTNGRNFIYSFSQANGNNFGGNSGAGIVSPGCGGPLGTTGATSTDCLFWTPLNCDAAGMWGPGNATDPLGGYNPPGSNYVIECYVLPYGTGTYNPTNGGNTCHFFNSGANDFSQPSRSSGAGPGGVYFNITNDTTLGYPLIGAWVVGNANEGVTNDIQIGTYVPADTNAWMHVAVVNDNGTNTFYVNGDVNGSTTNNTIPNGNICAGTDSSGTQPTFAGYLDELRISTFAPGAFTINDLLLRPAGPSIITQPQGEVVWNGGAAPFTVTAAFDTSTTYQWELGGSDIPGATNEEYYLNVVTTVDGGADYFCELDNSMSVEVTSSNALLTVVDNNPTTISTYRTNVLSDPGLLAYFEVDSDTGTNLTDSVSTNVGVLEGTAEYDGRTNRAFGSRALRFRSTLNGDVTITNNPQFEFGRSANGTGTIEAIVALDPESTFVYQNQYAVGGNETIFAEADVYSTNNLPNPTYYEIQTSPDGGTLYYQSDAASEPVTWSLANALLGRAALVDIVFTNGNVTAYVDGLSLGTQANPGFGTTGGPAWIGSSGGLSAPNGQFTGDIDEIAIYSDALPANTIALHNSAFVYGTNTFGPSITAFSGASETLLAGGLAAFSVTAIGPAPLSYQWTSNSAPIAGATASTLILSPTTTNMTATYGVSVSNPNGQTNSPTFNLTFVAPTNFYTKIIMADNPMAFWQLNETSGTIAYDSAGGNNGTYMSTNVVLGQPGVPGLSNLAAYFDGASSSYVNVPFNPVLNPQGAFSVEFWLNANLDALASEVDYSMGGSAQFQAGAQVNGWTLYDNYYGDGWEIELAEPAGVSLWAFYTPPALGQTWYNVVGVYDGAGNLSIYVNGQLLGQNSMTAHGGVFAANPSAPLVIGARNDLAIPFLGFIQDFTLYNYALSPQQILTHYTVPPSVVQQPLGVTNEEGSTVTLTPSVAGSPNGYQWYFNNQPLSASALNSDGTDHYSGGVTNPILLITEAVPTDSGTYFLAITNPIQDIVSSNAVVVITPNTNPPSVKSVTGLGTPGGPGNPNVNVTSATPYLVKVQYTKRVSYATGSVATNYSINNGVTIKSVTFLGNTPNDITAANLDADYREALLVTSGLTPGQQYSLTVSGLMDQSQTPLSVPTSTTSFRAPVLSTGVVNWDYYYVGTNNGNAELVSTLEADPNFQAAAPQTNAYFTAFDSDQITHGTLSDNPTFGILGDNYGDVVSGWITPTVSDNYTFFLATDDDGELDLSSDASIGNISAIAVTPSCCQGFLEPTSTTVVNAGGVGNYTSAPIPLTAGQSYYIQTLHGQGTGGDYVKVAWRGTVSTDQNTPAAQLSPIPGIYLSAYAPVAAPQFGAPGLTNGILTLNWSGGGTIQQSTNLLNWTNVPNNPNPLVVPVDAGTNSLFFRVLEAQ